MEKQERFATIAYYVLFVPRELAWYGEQGLRWLLCRVRGHRWTTPMFTRAGGMAPWTSDNLSHSYSPDARWVCGRCGTQGTLLSDVTFSTTTIDPYRIW